MADIKFLPPQQEDNAIATALGIANAINGIFNSKAERAAQTRKLDIEESKNKNELAEKQRKLQLEGAGALPLADWVGKGLLPATPEEKADKKITKRSLNVLNQEGGFGIVDFVQKASPFDELGAIKKQQDIDKTNEYNRSDKKKFDLLPEDNKKFIDKLATDNTNKIAIRTQIASTLELLSDPNIPIKDKLTQAKALTKTLNSQNGADAVGVEEANRLTERLNIFSLNPFSEGGVRLGSPDMKGFTQQVSNTLGTLDNSIKTNASLIDQAKSGAPLQEVFQKMRSNTQGSPLKESINSRSNQPPNGAQTVIQNGHTYNWNPKTGKYE